MEDFINNRKSGCECGKAIPAAGAAFEKGFMSRSLEIQVAHCDNYELAGYFRKWLPQHQPILEAGCASGRWVGWFVKNGWRASGLDWSEACCERARHAIPDARFVAGDMRNMPFDDSGFGAIVSLGAMEHSPEGPMQFLKEYHRVLRAGGIALITVPYLGLARRAKRLFRAPRTTLVRNSLLRRLLGKRVGSRTIRQARRETLPGYAADFINTERGWEFYQYNLSKPQMQAFLQDAGFEIIEEFVAIGDEGILHNFGRLSGVYDCDRAKVSFSLIGKVLRSVLSVALMATCFVTWFARTPRTRKQEKQPNEYTIA